MEEGTMAFENFVDRALDMETQQLPCRAILVFSNIPQVLSPGSVCDFCSNEIDFSVDRTELRIFKFPNYKHLMCKKCLYEEDLWALLSSERAPCECLLCHSSTLPDVVNQSRKEVIVEDIIDYILMTELGEPINGKIYMKPPSVPFGVYRSFRRRVAGYGFSDWLSATDDPGYSALVNEVDVGNDIVEEKRAVFTLLIHEPAIDIEAPYEMMVGFSLEILNRYLYHYLGMHAWIRVR
ncbi:hypothetical protein DM02DRAFT_671748 [Periconia macrospinosa]|uniref:Uncharacterized protein n=1 Tax=Periconia macrospinosa TaxID=97972 RepID=A0A2V1DRM7_9PLEO|nr:hypothetical protein DM02DRAFT_671748 [Periconia macrospinosa]